MLTVFFIEDCLYIIDKKKIVKKKMTKIINKGNIEDRDKFIEEFNKIIKDREIKLKLFMGKIEILRQAFYNKRDLFFLESVFLDLGFLKVEFLDVKELLSDDISYVEINDTYMVVYKENGALLIDLEYFKDIPKVLEMILGDNKDIALFGVNKFIPKIKIKDKNVYYIQEYKTFVQDCLLKVKKCGE